MEKLFTAGKHNHLQMVVKDLGKPKNKYYILGKTFGCLFAKFNWQWLSKSRSLIDV